MQTKDNNKQKVNIMSLKRLILSLLIFTTSQAIGMDRDSLTPREVLGADQETGDGEGENLIPREVLSFDQETGDGEDVYPTLIEALCAEGCSPVCKATIEVLRDEGLCRPPECKCTVAAGTGLTAVGAIMLLTIANPALHITSLWPYAVSGIPLVSGLGLFGHHLYKLSKGDDSSRVQATDRSLMYRGSDDGLQVVVEQ